MVEEVVVATSVEEVVYNLIVLKYANILFT